MNPRRGWELLVDFVVGGAIPFGIALLHVCSTEPALAQDITLDGTLGPTRTLTGPNYVIPQAVGQTVGSNLFHSFGQFNLKTGEAARFQSAANIRNILSRVTGGPSAIDGLIFTQSPSVNLFLLNPNGIVFGPNARINVGGVNRGSFVATTVDALVWPNEGQFSATNPSGPASLLTIVGDPSGFLASLRPPQAIISTSQLLAAANGQSLLLLGGDVRLDGGTLQAAGGKVELGGVAGAGTIGLQVDGDHLQLSFPDDVARADVVLTNGASVDVTGEGGSLAVHAQNLEMLGRSRLQAGIGVGGTADSKAGDLDVDARSAVHLKDGSQIFNVVQPGAMGKSGDVRITTGSLTLTNGAAAIASTFGRGNAGNVTITAHDAVSLDGIGSNGSPSGAYSTVQPGAVGEGGSVEITTGSLTLTNGAEVAASTGGRGNAGNVSISARDAVSLDGVGSNGSASGAASTVAKGAVGEGGSVEITTGSLTLTNGAEVAASTGGRGNAGNVSISARDAVSLDGVGSNGSSSGAYSTVDPGAVGEGGSVEITTGSLTLTNGAVAIASTFGRGNAGNVSISARDAVSFDGIGSNGSPSGAASTVQPGAVGEGGSVGITTGSLTLTNGGLVNAGTGGRGNAGNVSISARDAVSFDGIGSNGSPSAAGSDVNPGAEGQGGSVEITTGSLTLTHGAEVAASTGGRGNAGNVSITARDAVSFDGVGSDGSPSGAYSTVQPGAEGQGGSVGITTGSLTLTNGGLVNASTGGRGNAGNVSIIARSAVSLDGVGSDGSPSAVNSSVNPGAEGQGGSVEITTGSLTLTHGGLVNASTGGRGNAGNVSISARDTVSFDGVGSDGSPSGAYSTVDPGAEGQGGSVEITTGSLNLTHGGLVNASTGGRGNAGNVSITARDAVSFDGVGSNGVTSGAGSDVNPGAEGQGGSVEITTGSLNLTHGAEVIASTGGRGNAGNVSITARDAVSFDGVGSNGATSGAFSSVEKGAVGQGGNVRIATNSLAITNGALVGVAARGQGVAGNIAVNARTLFLDRGTIEAITASSNGGNMVLQIGDLLLLRHDSLISTTAGTAQGGGNGGNIAINAPLIVAVPKEDSDIRANAFTGRGGNIQIATQGIFGLQFRPQDTPLSDITVSSQFGINGTVQITTPGLDPSRGLAGLPTNLFDPSRAIANSCVARRYHPKNSFVITGTNGLPPRPDDATADPFPTYSVPTPTEASHGGQTEGVTPHASTRNDQHSAEMATPMPASIEEAQGWVYGPHGEVILTATAPTLTPQNAELRPSTCPQL